MTYLLDSSVLIDALNNRGGRVQILDQVSQQQIVLACCSVSVTELYMGLRPGEETKTERFLRRLEFYPVTFEASKLAGDLYREWRQKGQTLGLADLTIAGVALTHGLTLVTDNRKHFPMRELRVLQCSDLSTEE
jgi:predicted nucleic acid-binding protein